MFRIGCVWLFYHQLAGIYIATGGDLHKIYACIQCVYIELKYRGIVLLLC